MIVDIILSIVVLLVTLIALWYNRDAIAAWVERTK